MAGGIKCRSDLESDDFNDVASDSIIGKRAEYGLDKFVPFHWVYGSEFDYSIHKGYKDTEFAYIAIDRNIAKKENWKVIPQHPLAGGKAPEILDYSIGFNKIDWNYMKPHYQYYEGLYSYKNQLTTMAECLAPKTVATSKFAKIFVSSEDALNALLGDFEDEFSEDTDEDDFSLYEYWAKDQSPSDDLCDLESVFENLPDDLFEICPSMFKYYN